MFPSLDQKTVAEKIGLTFQQLQKYETGLKRIRAGRLYDLCQILNVPIPYFYEGFSTETEYSCQPIEESKTAATDLIMKGETLTFVAAYCQIKDPVLRTRILELAKGLAN